MKPLSILAALCVGSTVLVSATSSRQLLQSGQVFRGSTDAVTVDVAVRRGGERIEGLTAADFRLLDNGVPQHIQSIESTDPASLPVDVTVLVDTNEEVADQTEGINKQVARITSMLRPIDRLRVWRLNPWIEEVRPLETIGASASVPQIPGGGLVAVNDAVAAALMEPVSPDARHLVIAITNGVDTESVLRLDALKAIAEKTNATLHVAQIDVVEVDPVTGLWETSAEEASAFACTHAFRCQPTHLFFQPHYTPARGEHRFDPLEAVADETGGKLHTLGLFVEHNAFDVFANAFKDYQQNYILRYVPQGVPRAGWHAIEVTIPAHSGYTIHARRGYSMEGGDAPATTGPAVPPPAASSDATTIVQAYERGDYDAVEAIAQDPTALGNAMRGLRALGNVWPTTPHRESVLALDLVSSALMGPIDDAREAGTWLGDECRWLRSPLGPDAFEHDWLVAEMALLEGLQEPSVARPALDDALQRFPGDARLRLADAVLADQAWVAAGSPADGVAIVLKKYDDLAGHEAVAEVAAEARLRGAWMRHLAHQDADALSRLESIVDADSDRDDRYLRNLFIGEIQLALGRPSAAIDAARAALAIVPTAKAARDVLESALLASGAADTTAVSNSTDPNLDAAAVVDPWSRYDQGSYRQFPQLLDRLRAMVR